MTSPLTRRPPAPPETIALGRRNGPDDRDLVAVCRAVEDAAVLETAAEHARLEAEAAKREAAAHERAAAAARAEARERAEAGSPAIPAGNDSLTVERMPRAAESWDYPAVLASLNN